MKNNRLAGLVLLLCGWLMVGCGPSHQRVPVLETGQVLHLAVKLPKDSTADASGTVYYSLSTQRGPYTKRPLDLQGRHLVTTLETQSMAPGEAVTYYFDVFAGGEGHSLGSAQKPYVTEIVDYTELVQRSVASSVSFAKSGQPIVFKLDAAKFTVGKAVLSYTVPGLPGVVTQPMVPRQGVWIAEVPGARVAPGLWNWRIEAEIEGIIYTHPVSDGGFANFTVKD
ncbi:MAG: hypothetical protein AB8C95_14075 [Phycisphaeraceae bacterium]